jgi:hypothetical protein
MAPASARAVPPSARPGGGPRSHLRCSIPETSRRRAGRICRKPCGARALAVPATTCIGARNLSGMSRFWKFSQNSGNLLEEISDRKSGSPEIKICGRVRVYLRGPFRERRSIYIAQNIVFVSRTSEET